MQYRVEVHPKTSKRFSPKAQGCEERATLGKRDEQVFLPRRGCGHLVTLSHNLFEVEICSMFFPKVARSAQPWALRRNLFEVQKAAIWNVLKSHCRLAPICAGICKEVRPRLEIDMPGEPYQRTLVA